MSRYKVSSMQDLHNRYEKEEIEYILFYDSVYTKVFSKEKDDFVYVEHWVDIVDNENISVLIKVSKYTYERFISKKIKVIDFFSVIPLEPPINSRTGEELDINYLRENLSVEYWDIIN